jgi:hypothetical protein
MVGFLLDQFVRHLYGSLTIGLVDGPSPRLDWRGGLVNGGGDRMDDIERNRRDLEQRSDTVGWGLVFFLFAALAMPNGTGEYIAVTAVGGGMLALNAIRRTLDIPIRWFSVVLGGALLVAGCGALGGLHMDAFVLFFVLAGLVNVAAAVLRPRRATAS